jgi:hypothetical protein
MPTQPVNIGVVILTGNDLGAKIDEVCRFGLASTSHSAWITIADRRRNTQVAQIPIPEPSQELQLEERWVQCTLKNETQFKVLYLHDHGYLAHTEYWDPPNDLGPFNQMTWSGYNTDSPPKIVAAGTAFRLLLDDNNSYDISFVSMVQSCIAVLWMLIRLMVLVLQGWSETVAETYEAGVVESSEGVDGHEVVSPNGGARMSTSMFEGNDKDGNTTTFKFQISAAPSSRSLFVMKQVPVKNVF